MELMATAERIGIKGFMHPAECEMLAELAVNRDVLEVGSFCGMSAWCMAITAKSLRCVDTFAADSAGQRQTGSQTTLGAFLQATARFSTVSVHVCSSEEAPSRFEDDFDLIFLDAMHTYEDVSGDIARWWPRLRSGGVLALHDYGHDAFPGVKRAVDEVFGPGEALVTLRCVQK